MEKFQSEDTQQFELQKWTETKYGERNNLHELRQKAEPKVFTDEDKILDMKTFLDPTWDINEEFLNVYSILPKNPSGSNFSYLDALTEKSQLSEAYKTIIQDYLCAGIRVRDLESDTLRHI